MLLNQRYLLLYVPTLSLIPKMIFIIIKLPNPIF